MSASAKPAFKLYHYWRSSTSWRVRWAMEYKNIPFEPIHVSLLNGESESEEHLLRNPAGAVPVLETPEGEFLTESLAIIRYLDELYPTPSLFSGSPLQRAKATALSELVTAGIAALQNLPVMHLHSNDAGEQRLWAQHWIQNGLEVYEKLVSQTAGIYSVGDQLSIADLCLIPQCYNAMRYDVNIRQFPTISRIYDACTALESLKKSHPERYQPADFKP